MSVLGRHVIYDFPQYYNLFSRLSADAGMATVRHTNRRWLNSYEGGDGIKTGYTRAAGFNLVASAQRGQERVIATVFGGSSTASRNARITELMDMGFNRAPSRATIRRPNPPAAMLSSAAPTTQNSNPGKVVRVSGLVNTSIRPMARPTVAPVEEDVLVAAVDADLINSVLEDSVNAALAEALAGTAAEPAVTQVAAATPAVTPTVRPAPTETIVAALEPAPIVDAGPEVVTRISTSGGRHWGVNVGRYNTRHSAERVLLRVALNEMSTLDGSLRRVVQRSGGFDANFMGLTREGADLACRRLQARGTTCFMIGSEG
jgi:D-alanyl-D-alanine carboxypeptidase